MLDKILSSMIHITQVWKCTTSLPLFDPFIPSTIYSNSHFRHLFRFIKQFFHNRIVDISVIATQIAGR